MSRQIFLCLVADQREIHLFLLRILSCKLFYITSLLNAAKTNRALAPSVGAMLKLQLLLVILLLVALSAFLLICFDLGKPFLLCEK